MKAVTAKDVADEYTSSLADLTINSKPLINMLTMLAEDYLHHAHIIVKVVENHLQKVRSEVKLPVLYLIDSIVKNVGKDYLHYFTQDIVSIFCSVFEKVDERIRSQMFKLRQTWNDVFPQNKLFALDVRVHAIDPAWPITASSRRIHVNPKFLQGVHTESNEPLALPPSSAGPSTSTAAAETPQINDGVIREELLKQQKELLELQKRKVELELMQTKAILEEQQKKLENQAAVFISEQPEVKAQKPTLVSTVVQVSPRLSAPRHNQPRHIRHQVSRHQVPRHQAPRHHEPRSDHPRHHVPRHHAPRRSPVRHMPSPQRYSPARHTSPRHSPPKYSPQHAHINATSGSGSTHAPNKAKSHKSSYRSRDPRIKRNRDKVSDLRSKLHSSHTTAKESSKQETKKKEKKAHKKLKERQSRSSSDSKTPIRDSKSESDKKSSIESLSHKKKVEKYDKELRTKLPSEEPAPPGVDVVTFDTSCHSEAEEIPAKKEDIDNLVRKAEVEEDGKAVLKEAEKVSEKNGKASLLSSFSAISINSTFSPLSCSTTYKSDQARSSTSGKEDSEIIKITGKKEAGKLRSKGGDTYSLSPISKEVFLATAEHVPPSDKTPSYKSVEDERTPPHVVYESAAGPSNANFETSTPIAAPFVQPSPTSSESNANVIACEETVVTSSSPFKDVDFRLYSSLGKNPSDNKEKEKKMDLLFGGEDVDLRLSTPVKGSAQVPADSSIEQSDSFASFDQIILIDEYVPTQRTLTTEATNTTSSVVFNFVTSTSDTKYVISSTPADELSKSPSKTVTTSGLPDVIVIDSDDSPQTDSADTAAEAPRIQLNVPQQFRSVTPLTNQSIRPIINPSSYITSIIPSTNLITTPTISNNISSVTLKPPLPPVPQKPPTPPQPPTTTITTTSSSSVIQQSVEPIQALPLPPLPSISPSAETASIILNQPLPPVTPSPPPPPIISKDDVAEGSSWANYKRNKNEDQEKISPKRDSYKSSSKKDKSSRALFRNDELDDITGEDSNDNGERNSSANCSLIIKEAEHQLSTGNITFSQYNRMLKEVIAINEERKLQEVLLKDNIAVNENMPSTESGSSEIVDKRVTPSPNSGSEFSNIDEKDGKMEPDNKINLNSMRKRPIVSNTSEDRKRFKSVYPADLGNIMNTNGIIYNRSGPTSIIWHQNRPTLAGRPPPPPPPLTNGPNQPQMGLRPCNLSQMGLSRYYWTAHPSSVYFDNGQNFRFAGHPPCGPGGPPNGPQRGLANSTHCLPNGCTVPHNAHCMPTNITNGPINMSNGSHGPSLPAGVRGPPGALHNCITHCGPPPQTANTNNSTYLLRQNQNPVTLPSSRPVTSTSPPLSTSKDLPPADPHVLEMIEKDSGRWIEIDGVVSEIRFYGETAVVLTGWSDAREVFFQDGVRRLIIDNREQYALSFNEPYREIVIDNKVYKVRLGAPTRELFIDGLYYEVPFGGPAIQIMLDGRIRMVQLTGPMPKVKIGDRPRNDLLVGKINLIVDARNMFPIYLDAKPQKFEVNGYPYILRFVEALRTVVINGRPFKFEYGGSPVPIYFRGERHFLRLSVLPHDVIPGYVNIVNMEGGRLPSPAPRPSTPPVQKPLDDSWWTTGDDTAAGNEKSLELLTSLMPTTTANITLQSYSIEQPTTNTEGSQGTHTFGNVNVGELFQKLVASGIVPPVAEKTNRANELRNIIEAVDFSKPETLKTKKQPGLISRLYSGIQCSSCGVRFPPEHTVKYSQHLDWHFRQNRRDRMSFKVARSRRWNYDVSDWIQFQEIEDDDDKIVSWFELQDKSRDEKEENAIVEEPTAPANSEDAKKSCIICHDEFELFFHHDKEEWHFRNAIRNEDKFYHPICYQEFLENRAIEQELSGPLFDESNSFFNTSDEPALNSTNNYDKLEKDDSSDEVEIVSIEKNVNNLDSTVNSNHIDHLSVSLIPSDEEAVEVIHAEVVENKETNSENINNEINVENDENINNEKSNNDDRLNDDDSDDDILGIEVLEQKVELYEIPDDEEDEKITYIPTKKRKHSISEEDDDEPFDYSSVQVKTEKIDGLINSIPKINLTKTKVVSSIDGNNELGDAVPIVLPKNKIKINISSKHLQPPRNESPKSPDSTFEEEEILSPASIKPKLTGKTLIINKPIKKGSDLSSLCCIM